MNDKLGKIGLQEGCSLVMIAAFSSAVFCADTNALYARGNSAYLSMLLCAFLALGLFLLLSYAMEKVKAADFFTLLRAGYGAVLARMVALLCVLLLLFSAAALLERFTLMLHSFVFVEATQESILLYTVLTVSLLAFLGFETLGRSALLFIWLVLVSLLGALLLAMRNYEPHRLAPFLGDGTLHMLENSMKDGFLFLPAFLGLLVVNKGVHGQKTARRIGYGAGIGGGTLAALCSLCLGMTYTYSDLAQMHSPMYRLTMVFRTGGYFPRLDLLLLFGWLMGGVLAGAFYIYAAALLYASAFGQRDVRPGAVVLGALAGVLALLLQVQALRPFVDRLRDYGFLVMAVLLLYAAVVAGIRGRQRHSAVDGAKKEEGDTHEEA